MYGQRPVREIICTDSMKGCSLPRAWILRFYISFRKRTETEIQVQAPGRQREEPTTTTEFDRRPEATCVYVNASAAEAYQRADAIVVVDRSGEREGSPVDRASHSRPLLPALYSQCLLVDVPHMCLKTSVWKSGC